jgi:hypothetical protein
VRARDRHDDVETRFPHHHRMGTTAIMERAIAVALGGGGAMRFAR